MIAVYLAVAIAVVVVATAYCMKTKRDEAGRDARIDRLEYERRALMRRLEVVGAGSSTSSLAALGRRIVAAVSAETNAPVVVLHVAPAEEPFALEVVAAVGVSSVGLQSPVAAREVLMSGIAVALGANSDDQRLVVKASSAVITPRQILLRPVRVGDRAVAVLEIGLLGPLGDIQLDGLDQLVATCGPAISHLLAMDYAHRLSTEVRAQAATVADVTTELDTVFEALADGVAVTDDRGAIVRVNPAGREILGIASADEPTSRRTLTDTTNPLMQALTEGGTASGLEVAIASVNGERRIVQVDISPLTSDPSSRASVAVFRSVTRERQLERELRMQSKELTNHVQELERATRLKSEFLANMSHELRTPLNAVIGFAEVLLDGTYGTLNDKQSECTRDVLAGGRHLLSLINDILDMSKIEAGKMELAREDLDLAEVAAQALTLVRPQAAAKSILLLVDVPPSTLVHTDGARIRQVFVNLLSNAVKFTPEKGTVGIEVRIVDDKAKITVFDTGIGIAKEHAGKIFQDFSQVDGSITRRFGGTGLGLAISKKLVEMQGGTIGFDSARGKGSRFFFTVPLAKQQSRPAFGVAPVAMRSSAAPTHDLRAKETVLVIDRDPAAGRLIAGILLESGIRTVVTQSLVHARELLHDLKFEAIVLDPDVDDAKQADVSEFLAAHPSVLTSSQREDELGIAMVGCRFVGKPVDRGALVEAVRATFARKGEKRRALVVDPSVVDAAAVKSLLEREAFEVTMVHSAADARRAIDRRSFHIVVSEIELGKEDALRFLEEVGPRIPVMVLTSTTIEGAPLARLEKCTHFIARKGTLSRSAFARHVSQALQRDVVVRPRILAVDDNEQNLRLIGAVLARKGYEMIEARDASSAVALARAERPNAILMDVMLPDVDGLDATRRLKADALTRSIPIIAVTANAMSGDDRKARDAGCCDYVTKPIDSQRLLKAVEGALNLPTQRPAA